MSHLSLSSDDSLAIRQLALLAIIMKGDNKYLSSLNEPISAVPRILGVAATGGEWILI